jgi:Cu/Ag efflux protein CusF
MIAGLLRIAALPLVVAMLTAPVAAASTTTTKGAIKSLDSAACTVTLRDNTTYQFGKHCNLSKLKIGEQIAIVWKQTGATRSAVQVFVAT